MAPASPVHRVTMADSRSTLLALLQAANRPLSVAEAAERVGLRPSTTRFHLDLLASAGLVDRGVERRATAGRPRIQYSLRPVADTPSAGDYEGLANALADQLSDSADPAGAALEAGRRWTETLGIPASVGTLGPATAIEMVTGHMDRLGFAPDRPPEAERINLRRCPFEAVARRQRGVVCGVHAGMLEETFRRLGGAVEVERLDAFAEDDPLLCVVHLRAAGPSRDPRLTPPMKDNQRAARPGRDRSGRAEQDLRDG